MSYLILWASFVLSLCLSLLLANKGLTIRVGAGAYKYYYCYILFSWKSVTDMKKESVSISSFHLIDSLYIIGTKCILLKYISTKLWRNLKQKAKISTENCLREGKLLILTGRKFPFSSGCSDTASTLLISQRRQASGICSNGLNWTASKFQFF